MRIHRKSPHRFWSVALAVALASIGLLAAGCGGGAKNNVGVAQSPNTTTTSSGSNSSNSTSTSSTGKKGDPAAYSACMRSHGVPKFPDPTSKGQLTVRVGPGTGLDPGSASFRAAQKACQKLAPGGGKSNPQQEAKALAQALEFSRCMRAHGVPRFPDPQRQSDGGIGLMIKRGSGLDPQSPQFQAAQRACQKLLPGGGPGGGGGTQTATR